MHRVPLVSVNTNTVMPKDTVASFSSVLTRLRFRHLQLLDALGQTRNLHLAAEQMHVTQPAATKILRDVEAMMGAPLFQRLPREMRPTDLGALVLRYARTTVGDLRKFISDFETLRAGGYSQLAVGAISASAGQLVPVGIRTILLECPHLIVKLVEQSSDQLAVWLEEKKLDIMIGRMTKPRHQAIFDFERLSPEPVWVVCRRDHPVLRHTQPALSDLIGWPWILYPPATAIRQLFDELFVVGDKSSIAGTVETSSMFSTLRILQESDMLSLQPRQAVEKYVDAQLLGHVPVPIRRTMTDYGIVTRKGEIQSEPMAAFIRALRTAARHVGK